jgi:hypothetical protein
MGISPQDLKRHQCQLTSQMDRITQQVTDARYQRKENYDILQLSN